MLDEYLIGNVSRISPEAPVPVLDAKSRRHVAGGAANVAANIRSLGGSVSIVGLIGMDTHGEGLTRILSEAGIGLHGLIAEESRRTISKTRIVAGQQQIVRIDHEDRSPLTAELQAKVIATAETLIGGHDVCVLSDYAKGLLTNTVCGAIIGAAKALGKPVVVDPKGRSFEKYLGCTLLTPNSHEAAMAAGITIEDETTLNTAGQYLVELLPGSQILITRGAEGMTLFYGSAGPVTVPALARRVFDVVGAGDTVVATLSVALAGGLTTEAAMGLASVTASIAVSKPGTATVTIEEIVASEDYKHLVR